MARVPDTVAADGLTNQLATRARGCRAGSCRKRPPAEVMELTPENTRFFVCGLRGAPCFGRYDAIWFSRQRREPNVLAPSASSTRTTKTRVPPRTIFQDAAGAATRPNRRGGVTGAAVFAAAWQLRSCGDGGGGGGGGGCGCGCGDGGGGLSKTAVVAASRLSVAAAAALALALAVALAVAVAVTVPVPVPAPAPVAVGGSRVACSGVVAAISVAVVLVAVARESDSSER